MIHTHRPAPENKTPSGLYVGMSKDDLIKIITQQNSTSKDDLIKIIGYDHYYGKVSSVSILNCETDIFMKFIFNDSNSVQSIGFGSDIP
jgi:hypothetical protein